MSAPTIDLSGTGSPEPPLPLFEVRAELERVTNINGFDRWVELAIAQAEKSGDFSRFHTELRGWLRTALSGLHQDEIVAAPYEERDALLDRLERAWIAEHPAHESFA
jgi:hypothetical protein